MPLRRLPPFRAFALAALAALVFTGCDNDPNPKPYHEKRPDGSPWRVRYAGIPSDPKSLDPQFAYDEVDHQILAPVYDMLLEYHPLKNDPVELIPCMLADMPKKEVEPMAR